MVGVLVGATCVGEGVAVGAGGVGVAVFVGGTGVGVDVSGSGVSVGGTSVGVTVSGTGVSVARALVGVDDGSRVNVAVGGVGDAVGVAGRVGVPVGVKDAVAVSVAVSVGVGIGGVGVGVSVARGVKVGVSVGCSRVDVGLAPAIFGPAVGEGARAVLVGRAGSDAGGLAVGKPTIGTRTAVALAGGGALSALSSDAAAWITSACSGARRTPCASFE